MVHLACTLVFVNEVAIMILILLSLEALIGIIFGVIVLVTAALALIDIRSVWVRMRPASPAELPTARVPRRRDPKSS